MVSCLCTVDSIRHQFLPGIEVVYEKARSVRQVCFFERTSFFCFVFSQPHLTQTQLAHHKHETEVASPQYTLHWHLQHLIPQNPIAAVSVPGSGQKKPQLVLPNTETRHWICQVKAEKRQRPSLPPLTDPFANPRTTAFAVPQQQRDQSPGEREPERPCERTPGGIGASAGEADRSSHSPRFRALMCMLFSQTGNTKNVCIPTRLDNAGLICSLFY